MAGDLRYVQITIFQVRLLKKIESIKDLGVTFDNKLKFDDHINNKISTAYQMLGIVKRNFIYLTADSFVVLYRVVNS